MIVSRKRGRDMTRPGSMPSSPSASPGRSGLEINEKSFLRDLVLASSHTPDRTSPSFLLDGLQRMTREQQCSQVGLTSQELFLSVVLEWQRLASTGGTEAPEPTRRQSRLSMEDISSHLLSTQQQSREHSTRSSDSEADNSDTASLRSTRKTTSRGSLRRHTPEEVSPTSVHNVPRDLSPLQLDHGDYPRKRIGAYTPRSRQELLKKYMEKRARRLSQNTVRYRVRKTLANARPRVKGRFVKTEQPLTAAAVQAMSDTSSAQ